MLNFDLTQVSVKTQAMGLCMNANLKFGEMLHITQVSNDDLVAANAERAQISQECVELALYWMGCYGYKVHAERGLPHLIVWDGSTFYQPTDHVIYLGREFLSSPDVLIHELVHSLQAIPDEHNNLPTTIGKLLGYAKDRYEIEAYSIQRAVVLAAAGGNAFGNNAGHRKAVMLVAKAQTLVLAPIQAYQVYKAYRNK